MKIQTSTLKESEYIILLSKMRWSMTSLFFLLGMNDIMFVHAGWIDKDTPEDKRVVTSLIDGSEYHLVRQT